MREESIWTRFDESLAEGVAVHDIRAVIQQVAEDFRPASSNHTHSQPSKETQKLEVMKMK